METEKLIEEMAKVIDCYLQGKIVGNEETLAKELYEIVVPEGAVVLTQDEVYEFRKDQAEVKFFKIQIQEKARKETAREILTIIRRQYPPTRDDNRCTLDDCYMINIIEGLMCKFGVEVEE